MNEHPDLIGGFNRLDSTCLKAGEGNYSSRKEQMDFSVSQSFTLTGQRDLGL